MSNFLLKGAVHIHTTFSDGTGDIDEISKSAKKAGLDWIIITDHNKMQAKEGIYNGVYVLVGEEISPSNYSNHCMALGLTNQIDSVERPKDYLPLIKKQNGISCICHPHESQNRNNPYTPIRWDYDEYDLVDGVELWNYFSNWTDSYNDKNLLSQAYHYLFAYFIKNEPHKETVELWDLINSCSSKIKFALAGLDAHRIKFKKAFFSVPVFPYYIMFNTVVNVIPSKTKLSENFEEAKKFILESVMLGKFYMIDLRRGGEKQISVVAHNSRFASSVGEYITLDNDSGIEVKLKKKADIKLIKDGVPWLMEKNSKSAEFKIKYAGKYRLEIYHKSHAWVYTNPIVFIEKGE